MRRVLAVAALGLLCGQAARAQSEPAVFGEDYTPPGPVWSLPEGSMIVDGVYVAYGPRIGARLPEKTSKELEAFLAKTLCDATDFQPGGGVNVDGSWFDQIRRSRSRLSWDSLLRAPDFRGRLHPTFEQFDSYMGLDALYWLSFFDSLAPLAVGPYMGPVRLNEPAGWQFLSLSSDSGL